MVAMLIAYDMNGAIVATLDAMVARDEAGEVVGLVDFEAHEAAGGKLRDVWEVEGAAGSGTWPEWLGPTAHDFRVQLEGKRIVALVHPSGHRRERRAIEDAVAAVQPDERGVRDIRHIVGGPNRPLTIDAKGRTQARVAHGSPAHLPIMGGQR